MNLNKCDLLSNIAEKHWFKVDFTLKFLTLLHGCIKKWQLYLPQLACQPEGCASVWSPFYQMILAIMFYLCTHSKIQKPQLMTNRNSSSCQYERSKLSSVKFLSGLHNQWEKMSQSFIIWSAAKPNTFSLSLQHFKMLVCVQFTSGTGR